MSSLDTEIQQLRAKLTLLEERKATQEEKKANPMKTLEDFLQGKQQAIERGGYSRNFPLTRFYDAEKVAMLEPILLILKELQQRVEALEAK
jgi:hypothetical protein